MNTQFGLPILKEHFACLQLHRVNTLWVIEGSSLIFLIRQMQKTKNS